MARNKAQLREREYRQCERECRALLDALSTLTPRDSTPRAEPESFAAAAAEAAAMTRVLERMKPSLVKRLIIAYRRWATRKG